MPSPFAVLVRTGHRLRAAIASLVTGVHPVAGTLEGMLGAVGLWPLVVLIGVFATRLVYPMDLEWCEGGILYQAYRLLHGLPIYVRNDPTWQPWPYPPGHFALLALVGIVRLDFWSGRLLSILSFGVVCFVLAREVFRHLGGRVFGLAAATLVLGILACAYPVSGQWYDLVRVDSPMMGLVFGAAALVFQEEPPAEGFRRWRRRLLIAGLMTAAVYTKQTAIFFLAWMLLFAFVRSPRVGLALAGLVGGMTLVILGLLQWRTHGAYWYWTVDTMKSHALDDGRIVDGLRVVTNFAPFWAFCPVALLLLAIRGWLRPRTVYWFGFLLAALPASLLPYAKNGGFLNNLIPILILVAPVSALLVGDLLGQTTLAAGAPQLRGGAAFAAKGARWGLLVGLAGFISFHPLDRRALVPDAEMWQSAREFNAIAGHLTGGLIVPELTFLPARSGQGNPHWHAMAIYDAIWAGRDMDEVRALTESGAHWVMLNSDDHGGFPNYVRSHARLALRVPREKGVRMRTGNPIVIDELWELR